MMSTDTLCWHKAARAQFPQGRIEGEGHFALVPCNPTGKVYLFFTVGAALAVRDHWPCAPMCFGNHKCIDIRPVREARQSNATFRSPAEIERDRP